MEAHLTLTERMPSQRPAGPKAFQERNWERAVAEVSRIEGLKDATGATAKQRQGLSVIGKDHRAWILGLAGARVPQSSKAQIAALHEILARSGGTPAALPRV